MSNSQQLCPECGLPIITDYFYDRKDSVANILKTLRSNNIVKNDPSLEMLRQVEYHIADAFVLLEEVFSTVIQTSDTEIREDARVKVEKNVVKIFEHLTFATDCSTGFSELHSFLFSSEQTFISEGKFLNLDQFITLIEKEKQKFI